MKINNAVFRYIEHEMYCYKDTKKEMELYKEEIMEGRPSSEVSVQSGPGDTTASKGIKLMTSPFLLKAEKTIRAVDNSLNMLCDNHRELFELKYIQGLPVNEVYLEMNISERSYYRIRRQLVTVVGQQLGLINVE